MDVHTGSMDEHLDKERQIHRQADMQMHRQTNGLIDTDATPGVHKLKQRSVQRPVYVVRIYILVGAGCLEIKNRSHSYCCCYSCGVR
jgi:hypothetical protein